MQRFHSLAGSLGSLTGVASRNAPQMLGLTWLELEAAESDIGLVEFLLKPKGEEYGTPADAAWDLESAVSCLNLLHCF